MNTSGKRNHLYVRAFTLLELLVATAITVVLAGILVLVTANVLQGWNRTQGRLATHNQAKFVLDALAEDLANLVLATDGSVRFFVSIQRDQHPVNGGRGDTLNNGSATEAANPSYVVPAGGVLKPGSGVTGGSLRIAPGSRQLSDYRFGQVGVWLMLITTARDSNEGLDRLSLPRAVSYQIVRIPVRDGTNSTSAPEQFPDIRYALFRSELRQGPFTSSSILLPARHTLGLDFDLANPAFHELRTGANAPSDPSNARRPFKNEDLIANHVIDFGIRAYEEDVAGNTILVFPTNATFTNPRSLYLGTTDLGALPPFPNNGSTVPGAAAVARGLPVAVEIFLRVLTPEGARQIQNLELGRLTRPADFPDTAEGRAAWWWSIAEAHSEVFIRRVEIPSRPF